MIINLGGKTNQKTHLGEVEEPVELAQEMHIRTILVLFSMSLDSVCF